MSASVEVGATQQFAATVAPSGSDQSVTWSVEEGASCGSVDSTGLYTAPSTEPGTDCDLIATSDADSSILGGATITVTPAPVGSVVVDPVSPSIEVGATQQFGATVSPVGALQAVAWTVQESSGCGSIDSTGLYSAPATVPGGMCHIIATSTEDNVSYGSSAATVTPAPVASVSTAPNTASVQVDATQQFVATVTPAGALQTVTWAVTGGVSCGSVNSSGLYTAPDNVPAGTCHVVATSTEDALKTATAQVTVTPPPVASVAVSPLTANVQVNATQQFTASTSPPAAIQTVAWTVPSGVSCGSVDTNGLYTAPGSVPSGSCQVVATSTADASKSAAATVTITSGGQLVYTNPSTANAEVALMLDAADSTSTTVVLNLVTIASVTGFGVGMNLPLDATKVQADATLMTPGSALSAGTGVVAAAAALPASGPLAGILVSAQSQKAAGGGAVTTDTTVAAGTTLYSLRLDLNPSATTGNVFNGASLQTNPKFVAMVRDLQGNDKVAASQFAIGSLDVQIP